MGIYPTFLFISACQNQKSLISEKDRYVNNTNKRKEPYLVIETLSA